MCCCLAFLTDETIQLLLYIYNMYKHTETNRFMLTDSDLRDIGLSRVHMFCWTAQSHMELSFFRLFLNRHFC